VPAVRPLPKDGSSSARQRLAGLERDVVRPRKTGPPRTLPQQWNRHDDVENVGDQEQDPGSVFGGIDWGDQSHAVAVTNEESAKLAAFRLAHTKEGFDQLVEHLRRLGVMPVDVRVAMERPDGLLVAALLEQGYAVYPINPKVVERYRERHHPSGAKDDAQDAQVLAHLLRTDGERFRPLTPESDLAAELRLTVRASRELVEEDVRRTNHLPACLADYSPVARDLFSALDAPISRAFLAAFPTPEASRQAGERGSVAWLTEPG
jgi:hypothetical protein